MLFCEPPSKPTDLRLRGNTKTIYSFKVWPQQVFREQKNSLVVCSPFFFPIITWHAICLFDTSDHLESAAKRSLTLLNKDTDKNLETNPLFPPPLWKGKSYSWIKFGLNFLLSLQAFLTPAHEQEHPLREFLQCNYSIPLQNGYFSRCPHADKLYFKSLPMGLCVTQLTFESI